MKKRVLSTLMATAIALSLAVPAFATAITAPVDGVYGGKTDLDGTTTVPVIKITVPATGDVVINPYKLEATLGSGKTKAPLISEVQYIINESNVPLKVSASVTATAATGITMATTAPAATVTTKSVFAYLQAAPTTATGGATAGTEADPVALPDTTWETKFSATVNPVAAVAPKVVAIGEIPAATKDNAAKDAKLPEFLAYRMNGVVATNPKEAWASTDTVDLAIAFTFVPQVLPDTAP